MTQIDAGLLADAIEKADWANTSIGNKALLQAAVVALRAPLSEAGVRESIARAIYRTREWCKMEGPYTEIIKEMAIIEKRVAALSSLPPTAGREALRKAIVDTATFAISAYGAQATIKNVDEVIDALLCLTPSPSAERRVERIEHIAAIISDEYKTNSQGMLTNSHDLARMIVDAQPASPPVSDASREALESDENYPDCSTARERELFDALMGLASHATAFHHDYKYWVQGGMTLEPVVSKALRLNQSFDNTGGGGS